MKCSLLCKLTYSALCSLSWYFNKLLVCWFSRSTIKVNPLPNSFIYSCILVIPCIFGRLYPFVFVFFGKNCCNDWSTLAISGRALITSTLLFESWNHSSIQRYCFKNLMYCFHFVSEYLKDLFITWLPFVVCAIHSSRNKIPFRSKDWHFVPSIRPFLSDPHGKSCSLCLFIRFDIRICCLSMRSLFFKLPSDP